MNVQKKILLLVVRIRLSILSVLNPTLAGKEIFRLFCTPFATNKKNTYAEFANAEPISFLVNNLRVSGYRSNLPSAKKVLLLHGFSSSCNKFHHFAYPLVAKGYEVIAFDAPAHGSSEGRQVNALIYAEAIKKAAELYGPFHAYIAHSLGGLAICLALEDMYVPTETKLVLIAPVAETTTAINNAFALLKMKNKKLRHIMEQEILRVSGKPVEWFSIRRALKNIPANVLWIQDEDDNITPMKDAMTVKNDLLAHVKFLITSGLGHQKIYRDAQVINAVVDFF